MELKNKKILRMFLFSFLLVLSVSLVSAAQITYSENQIYDSNPVGDIPSDSEKGFIAEPQTAAKLCELANPSYPIPVSFGKPAGIKGSFCWSWDDLMKWDVNSGSWKEVDACNPTRRGVIETLTCKTRSVGDVSPLDNIPSSDIFYYNSDNALEDGLFPLPDSNTGDNYNIHFGSSLETAQKICELKGHDSLYNFFLPEGYDSPRDNGVNYWTGSVWEVADADVGSSNGKSYTRLKNLYCINSQEECIPETEVCDNGIDDDCDEYIDDADDDCEIACEYNSDCGSDGYVGDAYCSNDDVYQYYKEFTCSNPGAYNSECSSETNSQLITDCSYGCSNDECIDEPLIIECNNDLECEDSDDYTIDTCVNPGTEESYCSYLDIACIFDIDCGVNGFIGDSYCGGGNVVQDYQSFTCETGNTCSSESNTQTIETCLYGCSSSVCLPEPVECSADSDCDSLDYYSDNYCFEDDSYKDFYDFSCESEECSLNIDSELVEECAEGCADGECVLLPECSEDSECSSDYYSDKYCDGNDIYRDFHDFSCENENCAVDVTADFVEECDEDCDDGKCVKEREKSGGSSSSGGFNIFSLATSGEGIPQEDVVLSLSKSSPTGEDKQNSWMIVFWIALIGVILLLIILILYFLFGR